MRFHAPIVTKSTKEIAAVKPTLYLNLSISTTGRHECSSLGELQDFLVVDKKATNGATRSTPKSTAHKIDLLLRPNARFLFHLRTQYEKDMNEKRKCQKCDTTLARYEGAAETEEYGATTRPSFTVREHLASAPFRDL